MEPLCLHLNCGDENVGAERRRELANEKMEALGKLENHLWQRLGSEGRSEVRMWLCKDLGFLQGISRELQSSIFSSLIRPGGHSLDELLCKQALRIACERQPRSVMKLFSRDSKLIRSFFSGNDKRMLDWFEKFSTSQRKDELGAQALARFAFVHREKFWNELEWKGAHGQAPATVASKPHYFLDLDVLKTVDNFLNYVPEFWSSDELWDSLKDGDLLSLDIDFFVGKLFQKMEDGSSHVWKMLRQFFWEDNFTHLCHRLLSFLDDQKLLDFLNKISHGLALSPVNSSRQTGGNDNWLIKVLRLGAVCPSLECVMICNGCISHSRQLYRLLEDGESLNVSSSFSTLLVESTNTINQKHHGAWKDSFDWSKWDLLRAMALESWAIQVLLSKEYTSLASLRALLSANLIQFRQTFVDEEKRVARVEQKMRRKKKRRKRRDLIDGESDIDCTDPDLAETNGCWYLAINNYSLGMGKDEIPEQLIGFALKQWLNMVLSNE